MQTSQRPAMHDAERHARNATAGNLFTLAVLDRCIAAARDAYHATPEARVAMRLQAAIDTMEMAA